MRRGTVTRPFCGQTADAKYLRSEGKAGRLGQMPLAVVLVGSQGKTYRPPTDADRQTYAAAQAALERLQAEPDDGLSPVPDEPLPTPGTLGFRVNLYGLTCWGDLFNARQALAEILPEGDKEKQMLQGLLASKGRVAGEVRRRELKRTWSAGQVVN